MSDEDLLEKITALLEKHRAGLTASELAREIGSSRRDVNQVLYRQIGVAFRHTKDQKPKWSLIDSPRIFAARPDRVSLPTSTTGPIHVDFQGGDWTIEIRHEDRSRNDPPFSVERSGDRRRIITISNAYDSSASDSESLSTAGLVLAASALAWEIALQRGVVDESDFDWDEAIRDVLLNLAAHEVRTSNSIPHVGPDK